MAQQTIDIGSAPNDGTGDPIRDAFDKCNDNFTELYTGLTGLLDFKGSTDCSANPNYPAASKGDFYVVSVAGKIGGASGIDVEVGDAYFAKADNAGGTQAAVGTSWSIVQGNTTGAGAGIDVEDEGVSETVGATILNFVGAGVTAADAGGGQVDITIPGGGGTFDLGDADDVDTTGAASGNVLTFDGTQWEPAAPSGAGKLLYVGTATVAGSAATTLTLSSLDLNTDQRWFIRGSFHNATTSTSNLSLYFNADTTATNYNRELITATGVTLNSARANDAIVAGMDANNAGTGAGDTEFEGHIFITRSGFVVAQIKSVRTGNTTIQVQDCGHQWRTASTNVTGITISASVASSLDVGGKIELWKVST